MNNKILDLAKKLYALSERGIGGEKENAANMLNNLMEKHSISLDDIIGEIKKKHFFIVKLEQRKFFFQVVASVIGNIESYFELEGKKTKLGLMLTDADFIEISAKFEFYWKSYEKDMKIFYSAFIQKNSLYRKKDESKEPIEDYIPTEEDFRMFEMMKGIDKHIFQKRLNH
jgi:hypothetical protein